MTYAVIRIALAIAVAATGMALAAGHAGADGEPGTPGTLRHGVAFTATQESYAFSESQLEGFVIAAIRIDRVIRQVRHEVGEAAASDLARAVRRQRRRIVSATPGIDFAMYRQIARAVRTHEPTRTRVRAALSALRRTGRLEPLRGERESRL